METAKKRRPLAVCIYESDPVPKTLHREGLPALTPCGLAFTEFVGASPGVIENGIIPKETKILKLCKVCFPPGWTNEPE